MGFDELIEAVRSMYIDDGSASSLKELQHAMLDGGEQVITQEELEQACEILVGEGMLEMVGQKYRVTKEFARQQEQDFRESVADAIADHVIKKAAGK